MATGKPLHKTLCVAALSFVCTALSAVEMVDEVNPFIGCITQNASSFHGLGKTFPGAATPCGMIQLSPDTITGGDNGPGYSWCMGTIEGFSFTHLSGIGWYGEFGNFQVMPTTGPRVLDREKAASPYSHEREVASPGYYAVTLDRYGVRAEMTAAPRAGMLRFTFPRAERVRVQIDLGRRIGQKERWLKHSRQHVRVVDDRTIEGFMHCPHEDGGWGRGGGKVSYTQHFRCVFSRPFVAFGTWDKDKVFEGAHDFSGTNTGFFAEFDVKGGDAVVVRAGLSYVDGAGARLNLDRDMPDFDFDAARARARALWQEAFDGVRFEGGTKDERAVFATALYHSLIDPRMIADADGRYTGSDGKVYQSSSFTLRTVFSGWDVFRSEFPLLTIIRPDIVDDTINSMIRWNELGPRDTLPVWDIFGCLSGCMIGNPLIPCMADAWEKGIRGWPAETAWRLAEHTSSVRRNADCGWTPGSLSTTLEYAFDDWCMGKLADMLGKPDRARHYYSRAQCYTNCWSAEVGWMRARRADGSWLPWLGRKVHGRQGTVESNPYQQAWFVPHDVYGLMRLMGGECKFADEVETFFDGAPPDFLWNDYYNHPNEPVHHVPFMFPYCGKPWLTQKWTREICAKAYRNDVYGLCGNDDVGQMSAWYVLAASGLHPVAPGSGIWILTSPVFTKVSFRLDPKYYKGGTFTISAPKASAKNRYVRSAKLNGRDLDRMWLTTAEVSGGGVLELEMGDRPETARFVRRPPDVSGVRRETAVVASQEWTVWPCYGGGYVQNVVIAPSNPRVWYAYVDVSGPYRSDDAGRHWRPLHGNLAGVHRNVSGDCVRTLDVDPRDENSFVMCSGGTFEHPAGIFVSRDGGTSFRKTRCGRFYGNGVRRMLGLVLGRNPNNPDELVAGEDWDGVALSTDNGETWNTVGLERTWLTDLRYDKAVPNRIYACANPPNHLMSPDAKGACEFQGRTYETGLFRSDDGGRNWRKLSANAPFEICQIQGRDELIAYFHEQGVKRSRDGGETWEDFAQGLETAPLVNTGSSLSPGRYQAFGAGRDFYLVGNGKGDIYRRHVDAEAWTKVEVVEKRAGVPEKEPRLQYMTGHPMDALGSLVVDPQNNRHWLATDWFEIWETADAGAHWTSRIDGIMQLVSFTVECDPFSEKNIIYGVADMGLFSSQDGGERFWVPNGWVYACSASYSRRTPGLAMMCGGKGPGMVKRSKSAGRWWETPALRGLPKLDASNPGVRAYTIANNPSDDSFLILLSGPVGKGKGGIYRTANGGDDWEWFGDGLPAGVDLFKEHEWGKGGPFPQLYFGTDGSAVCYSAKTWKGWYLDKATSTWRESKGGAGICAADPFRPGRFLRAGKTLSESLDGGATFHPYAESNLGECSFVSFDAHVPNLVVAGISSDRSVAVSRDGGRHWDVLPGSERVPSGCSSKVLVDRKRLFYLTTGSGVFIRKLP